MRAPIINCTETMKELIKSQGELPAYAWPGGYPVFYLDEENNVLCPSCANENDDYSAAICGHAVNWEDSSLYCDDCGERIESAYAEED